MFFCNRRVFLREVEAWSILVGKIAITQNLRAGFERVLHTRKIGPRCPFELILVAIGALWWKLGAFLLEKWP